MLSLWRYFLLFFFSLIIFSCGDDIVCIEADDFGNVETEVVDVYPYFQPSESTQSTTNPNDCAYEIKPEDRVAMYNSILNANLKTCLKENVYLVYSEITEKITCQYLLEQSTITTQGASSQQLENIETAKNRLPDCEKKCKATCLSQASSGSTPWITNNPFGPYGNSVRIKPGNQIFMKLSGSITLDPNPASSPSTYEISGSVNTPNFATITGATTSSNTGATNGIKLNGSYAFEINKTASKLLQSSTDLSDPKNLENMLRRSIFVFKKVPPSIDKDLIDQAINPDPDLLQTCNNTFTNSEDSSDNFKLNCSGNSTTNSNTISQAYNINNNNDVHYGYAGGYVVSNAIEYNPIELNNIFSKTNINSQATYLTYTNPNLYDSYLNFKINEPSCSGYVITAEIVESGNVVFKIENLALNNNNFTSVNIPFYKGSIVKITPNDTTRNSTGDSPKPCYQFINMNIARYYDIVMPTSGFVEFKMKGTDVNGGASVNNCTIFGRILNPNGVKKLIQVSEPSQKSYITTLDFSLSELSKKQLQFEKIIVGLSNYTNPQKTSITKSLSCASEITSSNNPSTCSSATSDCAINKTSYIDPNLSSISSNCSNGNGKDGSSSPTNGNGNGGGGGGNIGGEPGKNGSSFINPEFATHKSLLDLSAYKYGNGTSNENGKSGLILLQTYNSDNQQRENIKELCKESSSLAPSCSSDNQITINKNTYKCAPSRTGEEPKENCLHFIIAGGAGGGTNCSSDKAGENGDIFEGEIDLSTYFISQDSITLNLGLGVGGNKASSCSDTSNTASSTTNSNYLMGGTGTHGGGDGGSASYIFITRSDETHDSSRNDFIVIAGGGAGASTNSVSNSYATVPSSSIENYALDGSLKRYAIQFKNSAMPYIFDEDNDYYHEYKYLDDPIFKNGAGLEINKNSYTSDTSKFYARKGQILRIYPYDPNDGLIKQFDFAQNVKKNCGVGMIFKITPRPAVICHISSADFPNPSCSPNFLSEADEIPTITSATSSSASSNQQWGCLSKINCSDDFRKSSAWNAYKLAGDNSSASGVANSAYCPISSCYKLTCSGGSAKDARTCSQPTSAPTGCSKTDPANTLIYTDKSCEKCQELRLAELNVSPQIQASNFPICYDYSESTNLSFHKKFAVSSGNINSLPTDTDKTNYKIYEVTDFVPKSNDIVDYGRLNIEKTYVYSAQGNVSRNLTKEINFNDNGRVFGFLVGNLTGFKDLQINSGITDFKLVFDYKSFPTFRNGEFLDISLCKESSDDSTNCQSVSTTAATSSTQATQITLTPPTPPTGNINYLIKWNSNNPPAQDNLYDSAGNPSIPFKFNSVKEFEKTPNSYPNLITPCKKNPGDDDSGYFCFENDINNSSEINKYRLAFRINDPDGSYDDNYGKYRVEITVKKPESSKLEIMNKILDPIIEKIDGKKDDITTSNIDESTAGFASSSYLALIDSIQYKKILNITVALLFTFYGFGYLIGTNELKHSEIVKILLKIGIVYLFTNPDLGYVWFDKFFIQFFKNSTDLLSFMVAQIFDNSPVLANKIANNDFSNKTLIFLSTDKVLSTLLSSAVQNKILALIFSSIWGWVYFLIIFNCVLLYFYAIANSILLFITCQVITSILLTLAPIIFLFIFFNITKEIFDNWLKALIGFSLQQIFLVLTLSFFNILFLQFLKLAIGYRVCWSDILSFNVAQKTISLLSFWTIAGTNSQTTYESADIEVTFGNDENTPSLYSFLTLWVVVGIMKKFIDLFTNLAVSLSGGIKASSISGEVASASKSLFGAVSSRIRNVYNSTIGRAVDNVDNVLFASGKIADEKREEAKIQFANDMKTRVDLLNQGNNAVSKYKKEHGLELSRMSHSEQKERLTKIRNDAIKVYAEKNGIKNHEKLMNSTGLNYTGTNLFGLAFQTGRQAVSSGGNLINSSYDRTVKTSFTKDEAREAMKKMDKSNKDGKNPYTDKEKDEFIKNIKDGKIEVRKGKFEIMQSPISSTYSSLKSAKRSIVKSAKGAYKNTYVFSKNEDKERAIYELSHNNNIDDDKKIKILKGQENSVLKGLVNWSRNDKEKALIREKMREYKNEREGIQEKVKDKTSKYVIEDLERSKKYFQEKHDMKMRGEDNPVLYATINKNISRAKNLFKKREDNSISASNSNNLSNSEKIKEVDDKLTVVNDKLQNAREAIAKSEQNNPVLKLINEIKNNNYKFNDDIKGKIENLKNIDDLDPNQKKHIELIGKVGEDFKIPIFEDRRRANAISAIEDSAKKMDPDYMKSVKEAKSADFEKSNLEKKKELLSKN